MKINYSPVGYSSIVEIGERVAQIEKKTGDSFLKLHRGVMDVEILDINCLMSDFDYNQKSLQQYGANDGDSNLIKIIKEKFNLQNHFVRIAPGGMATLDLVINSLSEKNFWIPKFHWGSWNKILKIHGKNISEFDDFNLKSFRPTSGVVMLCFPSNPTGWLPTKSEIKDFLDWTKQKNITVILDLPYYYLFNDTNDDLCSLFYDNVIVVSSFSKSIGLSGFRVGYIATKNEDLHNTTGVRSLYKYNSISNLPQSIIRKVLESESGLESLQKYQSDTCMNIKLNIEYLKSKGLLFEHYPSDPLGPFVIVNQGSDKLFENKISSVPLNYFSLTKDGNNKNYSRISVAVNHELLKKYFNKII